MFCRSYLRALLLLAVIVAAGNELPRVAQTSSSPFTQAETIHLRWGARPGVSRYRLQLAVDRQFRDIVFDRVINGTEIAIDELSPGRYYWRIASLTSKLGEFSSPTPIQVTAGAAIRPTPTPTVDKTRVPAADIPTVGGWRAAVGSVNRLALAHLRADDKFDVIGTSSVGITFALDASTGVALWSMRRATQKSGSLIAPLILKSHTSQLDDVVIFAGNQVIAIEGASGRELWQMTLPASANGAAVIDNRLDSRIVILDITLQRLLVLSDADGRVVSQANLPARVVGTPVSITGQNAFAVVYESGAVEIRDKTGAVTRSGNTGSPATTGALFTRGPRGDLILVGTRDGLTAMTADDLRPLGRVVLKDDLPRGALTAEDLNHDGVPEVLMLTARRHLVAINATDGKILWDVPADAEADALAFADVDGDGVLDVFTAPGQAFAVALSGRTGAVIWKDSSPAGPSANHAAGFASRTLLAVTTPSGLMLIGSEPSLTELRAVSFPKLGNGRGLR